MRNFFLCFLLVLFIGVVPVPAGATSDNYLFDKRLGDGATPWNNPAAAMLYCDDFLDRAYSAGEYICTPYKYGDISTPRLYQITSLFGDIPRTGLIDYSTSATAKSVFEKQSLIYVIWDNRDHTNPNYMHYVASSYFFNEITPPAATCIDNVMNGTEVGVDCGGPCNPCAGGVDTLTETEEIEALAGVFVGFSLLIGVVKGIG